MSKANLTHHFLIAAPELSDPRFEQALIYICRHDKHGALGLMVNRPLEQARVGKLLEDLDIEVTDAQVMEDVALDGGPMYPEVGLCCIRVNQNGHHLLRFQKTSVLPPVKISLSVLRQVKALVTINCAWVMPAGVKNS